VQVDGNDVLACHAVTARALERARAGEGPTLIEAFTYRMGAHTTNDDPSRYRVAAEVDEWQLKDPVRRMRSYLEKNLHINEEFFADVDAEADQIAADLRERCLALPDPAPLEIFDHVYGAPHPLLTEERGHLARYMASFLDA
jgi:2-oxoisovalerate dehydrogenase E1 component alpha subunit